MKGVKKAKIVKETKKSQQPRPVPKTIEEMKAENERARVRARKAAAERERKRNRAATWDYLKKTPFFFKVIAIIVTIVIVTVSIIGISALISGLSTQTSIDTTSMVEPEETALEVKSSKVATTETPAVPETGKVETEIKTTPIYIYLNQGSTSNTPAKPTTPAPAKPTTPTFDHENYDTDDNYEEPLFPIAPTEPEEDPEEEEDTPAPEESEEPLDSVQNPTSVL